jgi:hypothetical protein
MIWKTGYAVCSVRSSGEIADSRFPLPDGGGGWLVEGAVARKDENLNCSHWEMLCSLFSGV